MRFLKFWVTIDDVFEGCLTIRALAVNDSICKDITTLGGTELLVQVMNQHIEHVKFCTYACTAIKMISNNDANKALLCANGGINIILGAMSRHSDEVAMQTQGLAALSSMALRNSKTALNSGSTVFHYSRCYDAASKSRGVNAAVAWLWNW